MFRVRVHLVARLGRGRQAEEMRGRRLGLKSGLRLGLGLGLGKG